MANIGIQSLDTGNFEHHLMSRSQKKKSRKKTILVSLMLTSMVDMFSMLVCFLLVTFSSTPEISITNGVELPRANSGVAVKEASVIAVTKDALYLDQEEIGPLDKVLKNPNTLVKKLSILKKNWKELHPGADFTGRMNLQADQSISSITVSKIMGILTGQDFNIIQMATLPGGFSEKTQL